MKLYFRFLVLFLCVVLIENNTSLAKEHSGKYSIDVGGINIGNLDLDVVLNKNFYNINIDLKNKGIVSRLYSFEGAYSVSGTTDNNNQNYIKGQIGIITPTEYPKRSGADPSCGGNDFATLSTCILNIPLNANRQPPNTGTFPDDSTRTKYNYPVQNLEWSKSPINILINKYFENGKQRGFYFF